MYLRVVILLLFLLDLMFYLIFLFHRQLYQEENLVQEQVDLNLE